MTHLFSLNKRGLKEFKNYMSKKEILNTIEKLSHSQGSYTRLNQFLNENTTESEEFLNLLESKNFKDPVDLILYFEG